MENKWIIISIVFVCIIALILNLIVRNEKDKEGVIKDLNETETDDEEEMWLLLKHSFVKVNDSHG